MTWIVILLFHTLLNIGAHQRWMQARAREGEKCIRNILQLQKNLVINRNVWNQFGTMFRICANMHDDDEWWAHKSLIPYKRVTALKYLLNVIWRLLYFNRMVNERAEKIIAECQQSKFSTFLRNFNEPQGLREYLNIRLVLIFVYIRLSSYLK